MSTEKPKKPVKPRKNIFEVSIKAAKTIKKVLVSFSGGKDSLMMLDLCMKYFDHVEAFFMYTVPDLACQQEAIIAAEKRYPSLVIHQTPSWLLVSFIKQGVYRIRTEQDLKIKNLTMADVLEAMRKRTGIDTVALGWRESDSFVRRCVFKQRAPNGIDPKGKKVYPIKDFYNDQIFSYLKVNKIALPSVYKHVKGSYGGDLNGESLCMLYYHYPKDFAKVEKVFPFIRAGVIRYEQYLRDKETAEAIKKEQQAEQRNKGETEHTIPDLTEPTPDL